MWAIIRAAQFEGLPVLKSGWRAFWDGAKTQVDCIQFMDSKYPLKPINEPCPLIPNLAILSQSKAPE
jgi:hypothetical protein